MAATIIVNRLTGAGPTATDITSSTTYFVTEDAHYASSAPNPVPIPTSGTNYSYWVTLRLECTVAPTTLVNNLQFYMNAPWGGSSDTSFVGQTASSYVQATGTVGTTGTELTAGNHAGLTGAVVDPFTWTSASPKAVSGSTSTAVQFGDRVVLQAQVASTETGASQPTAGFTWQWDET